MHRIILFVLVLTTFSCTKDTEVNLRLSNKSSVNFQDATFNNTNFGDLAPGETSEYRTFKKFYGYGSVSITIDGENYGWMPIDYVGEEPVESGNYTFEYRFNTDTKTLTDRLIKD